MLDPGRESNQGQAKEKKKNNFPIIKKESGRRDDQSNEKASAKT